VVTSALRRLHALRGSFTDAAARERREFLIALDGQRFRSAAALRAWHDELLFLVAFPDARASRRGAERALRRIERHVAGLPAHQRGELADSGIAGSTTEDAFMFGVARWLARSGEAAEFAWARTRDAERLDPLLRLTLTAAETDRFDSGRVGSADWLAEASRRDRGGALHWLLAASGHGARGAVRAGSAGGATDAAWRDAYDAAEPQVRWSLATSRRSVTLNRVEVGRPVVRREFRGAPADPVAHIATPLRGIERLSRADAARWHDAALASLAARAREVFPTIYANHDELYRCPLGAGTDLLVIGVAPEDRSALEANYGYVMFSNGVPIGYGGVTTLGAQANTGVNLFESFRRSEAAFLFAQSLRAFRTLFGVTRFVVNPYQFGRDNEEALASGAYWFYDRLGFRPTTGPLRALATRERRRLAKDPSHRTGRSTLARLARGDLILASDGATGRPLPERLLIAAGGAVTDLLSNVAAAERDHWIDEEARRLIRACTGERRKVRPAERLGARLLVPVLAGIVPEVALWPDADRRALWKLVRLKGAAQERGFARAAGAHDLLWPALLRWTARHR